MQESERVQEEEGKTGEKGQVRMEADGVRCVPLAALAVNPPSVYCQISLVSVWQPETESESAAWAAACTASACYSHSCSQWLGIVAAEGDKSAGKV